VDQRGHGLSDKPDEGYGFDEVTADLKALIEALGFKQPIVAGQSWGGNVVLELAARWPDAAGGLVLVDGGFIDLSSDPGATWEKVSVDLRPPPLAGTPRIVLLERLRSFHPSWDDEQIEMQMGNFETLEDGTVRPWLSLERHLAILRALWEQKPSQIWPRVSLPALIAVAPAPSPERQKRKAEGIAAAQSALAKAEVRWFDDSVHDIHVDRPAELAQWVLAALTAGFFGER
jgi:pimeloyl-ACP methyl ester carboxylesterase